MFWLLAIILLGVGFYLGMLAQRAEQTGLSFPGPIKRIELHLPAGRVRIKGSAATEITGTRTLRYLFRRPTVTERVEGDVLHIEGLVQAFAERGGFADYELTVPSSLEMFARTGAGSLDVDGLE